MAHSSTRVVGTLPAGVRVLTAALLLLLGPGTTGAAPVVYTVTGTWSVSKRAASFCTSTSYCAEYSAHVPNELHGSAFTARFTLDTAAPDGLPTIPGLGSFTAPVAGLATQAYLANDGQTAALSNLSFNLLNTVVSDRGAGQHGVQVDVIDLPAAGAFGEDRERFTYQPSTSIGQAALIPMSFLGFSGIPTVNYDYSRDDGSAFTLLPDPPYFQEYPLFYYTDVVTLDLIAAPGVTDALATDQLQIGGQPIALDVSKFESATLSFDLRNNSNLFGGSYTDNYRLVGHIDQITTATVPEPDYLLVWLALVAVGAVGMWWRRGPRPPARST